MVKKRTLLNPENISITIKSIVVSIIALAVAGTFFWIGRWLILEHEVLILGRIIQMVTLIFYLFFWGYLANKFWNWK